MKALFATDITNDKKNEQINGREFITKTLSEETKKSFEDKTESLEASHQQPKANTPEAI